ncbi:MAG: alpha/beta hydrolase [Proteobacteria bacterium]|nr:alpha/beta hydrolase [Pseudomonadota bacterium]
MSDSEKALQTKSSFARLARGSDTIAYHRLAGRPPGIVFIGGFRSDMTGTKATYLEALARQRGQAFLRFDHFAHGQSSGRFEDATVSRWAADCIAVLDELTEGPQLLIGSSMGGWVMVLAARARPARIHGLIGIAPAPDFTGELMGPRFSAAQRTALLRDGIIHIPSQYGEPAPITRALIEDGARNAVLGAAIAIECPVRLLHGMADPDVPYAHSFRLLERLQSRDVRLTLIKDGDHRLSRDQDLALLARTIEELSD